MQHIEPSLLGISIEDLVHVERSEPRVRTWRSVAMGGVGLAAIGIALLGLDWSRFLSWVASLEAVDPIFLYHAGVTLANLLLIVSLLLLYFSIRMRFSAPVIWSTACPDCHDGKLVRIRRRQLQRIVGAVLWLPLHRYKCSACAWDGVRLNRTQF